MCVVKLAPLAQRIAAVGRLDLDHLRAEFAKMREQNGPAINVPSSSTLMSDRGPMLR